MEILSYDGMLKSQGYNMTGDQIVEDLRKALSTTSGVQMADGNYPMNLQNLDGVMTEVLITQKHFKIYNMLPKVPSATRYYEYNVHTDFGESRAGGAGFAEGGAPNGTNSSFERKGIYNKFLGVKGGITHQMLQTGQNGGAFEDPNVRENKDRTIALLTKVERELVHGQSAVCDQNGNAVNFDGLLTSLSSIYPQNVIDMKGLPLGFDQLDDSAEGFVTDGKQPSVDGYTILMSPHIKSGLNKQFASRNQVRFNKDLSTGSSFTPGTSIDKYDTNFGTYDFDHSILLQEVATASPLIAAPANVPASPAITTQPAAADDAAGNHIAGTVYYSIAGFNDTGESLPVITAAVAIPDNTTAVTIVVTRLAGATGYRIYRGAKSDGSDHKWIAKVAQTASGNLTFVDKNAWFTKDANGNSSDGLALVIKPDPADIAIAQMTPLIKMPLPQVDTTFPFLLLLYIVSVIKAPQRIKIYKNCGTYVSP